MCASRLGDKAGKGAAAAPIKPLTADEIVRQKARARSAAAAQLPGRPGPPKKAAARYLDSSSLLDAARERRLGGAPVRPAFPPPARPGTSLPAGACVSPGHHQQQRNGDDAMRDPRRQQGRPGSGGEMAAAMAWAQPPRLRMPALEGGAGGPAAGEDSREKAAQRACNAALVRIRACIWLSHCKPIACWGL